MRSYHSKDFCPASASTLHYSSSPPLRLCFIAHHTGFWVYPVFEVLDFKSRALFMASLVPPNLLFVFLGQKLHVAVWGEYFLSTVIIKEVQNLLTMT